MQGRNRWIIVAVTLLMALLLRVGLMQGRLAYGPPLTTVGDELDYHKRAVNLIHHGVFSRCVTPPFVPDGTRSPGLSAVLAATYALAGPDPRAGLPVLLVLNWMTVGLLMLLAGRFWGWRVAIEAGALLALDLNHAISAGDLLTESLSGLLVVAAVGATIDAWRMNGQKPKALLSGALWGLAALVHPMFTLVALPVLGAMKAAPQRSWRAYAVACGLWIVGFAVLLGPWMARNQVIFGVPAPIIKSGEQILLCYEAVVESNLTGEDVLAVQIRWEASLADRLRPGDQWQAYNDAIMRQEGLRLALQRPGPTAAAWAKGFVAFFLAPNRQRLQRALPPGRPWSLLWVPMTLGWTAILALAIYGLAQTYRRDPAVALLIGGLAVYAALLTGPLGSGRFRCPLDPLFCLMAAIGIDALLRRRHGLAVGDALAST